MSKISFTDYIRSINDNEDSIWVNDDQAHINRTCDIDPTPNFSSSEDELRSNSVQDSDFILALSVSNAVRPDVREYPAKSTVCNQTSNYLVTVCPACDAALPLMIPSTLQIPSALHPIFVEYVQAKPMVSERPLCLRILIASLPVCGYETSGSPVLLKYMYLYRKAEYKELIGLIKTMNPPLPCHICWLQLISVLCHKGLQDTNQSEKSYASFLDSLPVASPSIGLLVHWDKYIRACTSRIKNRELQEIRRYRKLMFGNLPTDSNSCMLCASPKSLYPYSPPIPSPRSPS
jgi:hypothetical protein